MDACEFQYGLFLVDKKFRNILETRNLVAKHVISELYVNIIVSLSSHEQVYVMMQRFQIYFPHLLDDEGRSISRSLASLNIQDKSKTEIFWIILEGLVSQRLSIDIRVPSQNHLIPSAIFHVNVNFQLPGVKRGLKRVSKLAISNKMITRS